MSEGCEEEDTPIDGHTSVSDKYLSANLSRGHQVGPEIDQENEHRQGVERR